MVKNIMRKFEENQFVIVWFSEEYENIDTETANRKKEAIKIARNSIVVDLNKVKRKHPQDFMKHCVTGARIYDLLNRSNYFTYLELKEDGDIIISQEPLNSELDIS